MLLLAFLATLTTSASPLAFGSTDFGTDANACLDLAGTPVRECILRADRFVESDPFIKHRSCGITENAVIEVDIDHHVVHKTQAPLPAGALDALTRSFTQAQGIPVIPFSKLHLTNYWKVLNAGVHSPSEGRELLSTRHREANGRTVIDAETPSAEGQALIELLDRACPPLEN